MDAAAPVIESDPEPENGELLKTPEETGGLGSLTVSNGNSQSAAVKLVDSAGVVIYEMFVSRGQEATIQSVAPGSYDFWFCFGDGWDSRARRFTVNRSAGKASHPFEFAETPTAYGTKYVQRSVTLHPVIGGNLHTIQTDADEFDRLARPSDSR